MGAYRPSGALEQMKLERPPRQWTFPLAKAWRYVVPQRLSAAAFQGGPVKFSLRVGRSFRNGRIRVEALMPTGEVRLLKKKPFMVAVPAEMMQLELPLSEAAVARKCA